MRKSICFMMISVSLFAALLSLRVQAASGDGLRLDEGGTVTVVSQHAAKEGISSLCFSLSVESANGASVEFQFGDSKAKILDYRYDAAAGNLKVYLAGTEALFAEGTDALTVGKIKVLDGGGNEVTATVSAVENSLQYVYGTEVKTMLEVELPEAVQIGPAPVQPARESVNPREPVPSPESVNPSDSRSDPGAGGAPASAACGIAYPPACAASQSHRESQAHGSTCRGFGRKHPAAGNGVPTFGGKRIGCVSIGGESSHTFSFARCGGREPGRQGRKGS